MPDATQADRHRLPRTVTPERYDITLRPDLDTCTYTGEEVVRIQVLEPVDEIVLNSLDLEIDGGEVATASGERVAVDAVELDVELERAVLRLASTLQPGTHELRLEFHGEIPDRLNGFYRSTFTDASGAERVIATTQFEATDARRAFPCWDEPDRKAVFGITLEVADGLLALSNAPVASEEQIDGGRRRLRFADTMKMSTYLVAFVVGPLEATDAVDVDGVPLRVITVPGKLDLAPFALEAGAAALRFFRGWFGLDYPGEKLDMVALPDFAFGAMENLGLVTYRETALLVDRDRASRADLERVADVVSHEIAHMWFGDLVTMKWWNGIWLNEAFATFMELLAVDDLRPEWERWVSFGASRSSAMLTDGLATTRPIEFEVVAPSDAEGMFDVLTYQKGGAVLRMLEQYLGAERFREGIRLYLKRHAHANTETSDLWDAIEEATGEPVRSTMDGWVFQGGHPLVSVRLGEDGRAIELEQRRFRYLPDAGDADVLWNVPVLVRAGVGGSVVHERTLLEGARGEISLDGPADWVVVNDGGSGFYRVAYDADLLRRITGRLAELSATERMNLVDDTWAATLAGHTPVSDFIELVGLLGEESDPNVWDLLTGVATYSAYGRLSAFDLLDRAAGSDGRPAVRGFLRSLLRPALERVGWEPSAGEHEKVGQLRGSIVRALGTIGGDEEVRDEARRLLERHLASSGSVDAEVVSAAIAVLAHAGGEENWELYRRMATDAPNPQEAQRFQLWLASFPQPELVRRTFDLVLTDEVRSQNAAFLVNGLVGNRSAGELAWSLVEERWDDLVAKVPSNSHARMLLGTPALVGPDLAGRVRRFLADHPVAAGEQTVAQAMEQLEVNAAFASREGAHVAKAIEAAAGRGGSGA